MVWDSFKLNAKDKILKHSVVNSFMEDSFQDWNNFILASDWCQKIIRGKLPTTGTHRSMSGSKIGVAARLNPPRHHPLICGPEFWGVALCAVASRWLKGAEKKATVPHLNPGWIGQHIPIHPTAEPYQSQDIHSLSFKTLKPFLWSIFRSVCCNLWSGLNFILNIRRLRRRS